MATENRRLSRRQLLLAYASGGFGLSMNAQVILLIPLQARAMGAGFDQVGLIIGSGSLAAALSSVALGRLVDRFGTRACYLLGTGSCALLSAAYIVPSTFWWFLALQPFLAVSRTLGWVASQAYISDIGEPSDRTTHAGRFSFCSNIGQLAGPLLAGAAAETVGLRWGLTVPAVYALTFFLLGLRLPQAHRGTRLGRTEGGDARTSALTLLREPGLRFVLVATFARIWVTIVFTTFLPILLVERGLGAGLIGVVMSLMGVVATVAAPMAGPLSRWSGSEALVATASVGCGALALVLTPILAPTWLVFVLPCLVGVGVGLSLPLLMGVVADSTPPSSLGMAMGLRSLANQTASTSGPVIIGPMIGALGVAVGFTTAGVGAGCVLVAAYVAFARGRHGFDTASAAPDGVIDM